MNLARRCGRPLRDLTLDARVLSHPQRPAIETAQDRLRGLKRALPGLRGRDRGLGHRDASLLGKQVRSWPPLACVCTASAQPQLSQGPGRDGGGRDGVAPSVARGGAFCFPCKPRSSRLEERGQGAGRL
ncbi:MAG: hypothetical protein WDW36_002254 [Sanguina aurantia]